MLETDGEATICVKLFLDGQFGIRCKLTFANTASAERDATANARVKDWDDE